MIKYMHLKRTLIISILLIVLPTLSSAMEMVYEVEVFDYGNEIVVFVKTSEVSEIVLNRFEPIKVSNAEVFYSKANFKVIGLNSVIGRAATFRLEPSTRFTDIVIPITLKYGDNETLELSYTILAEPIPTPTPRIEIIEPEQESSSFKFVLVAMGIIAVCIIVIGSFKWKNE